MHNTSPPSWGEDMRAALDRFGVVLRAGYAEYWRRRFIRVLWLLSAFRKTQP